MQHPLEDVPTWVGKFLDEGYKNGADVGHRALLTQEGGTACCLSSTSGINLLHS